jgi:hypothetical protein
VTNCGPPTARLSSLVTNGAGPFSVSATSPPFLTRRQLVGLVLGFCAGCSRAAPPASQDVIVWRPLASWSGRALLQTDAFMSSTGSLRITWEAKSLAAPDAGALKISVHSGVSGRFLAMAVEHRGPGRDVAYVNEDPREFFLVIESTGLEWSVEVAEGIPATKGPRR